MLYDFSNDLFGRKASLVRTDVTGPREQVYLAGVPIERILSWAPRPGQELGMAISTLSYRGMVGLTVIGDARLVPDPKAIADGFNRAFEQMRKRATTGAALAPATADEPGAVPARRRARPAARSTGARAPARARARASP